MLPNISKLTEKELLRLRNSVDKALTRIERGKKAEAKKAAEAAARKLGFSLTELIGDTPKNTAPKTRPKKPAAKPKYCNPADATQTWSGKGRPPVGYKDAIVAGTDPKTMEI